MTTPLRRLLATAAASVVTATLLIAQDPEFVRGDPGKLRCKILKAEKHENYHVLEVEVRNRSKAHAEPLRFRIQGRKPKRGDAKSVSEDTFDRARMPLVARFGEGIAPGKARRYRIHTFVPKQRGMKASVEMASFFNPTKKASRDRPTVRNLTTARGHNNFTGRTHDVASFEVENPFSTTADIWLRATFERPKKEVVLLAYRVRGKQTRSIKLGSRAPVAGFDDSGTAYAIDTEISKLEVIDWLQIGKSDEVAARKALLEALDGWAVWPASLREARASFVSSEIGPDLQTRKEVKLRTKGELVIGPDRKVRVEFDAASARRIAAIRKQGMGIQQDTEWMVRLATWQLRRPPTASLRDRGEVVWMTPELVLLRGLTINTDRRPSDVQSSDPFGGMFPRLGIRDGKIRSDGGGMWTTEKLGKSWILSKRHLAPPNFTRRTTETWKHTRSAGIPVVEEYEHLIQTGDEPYSRQVLKFSNWEFSFDETATAKNGEPKPAPQGPGAATLAAAWQQIHQLDADPVRWTADVHILNNGSDASWQGFDRFNAGISGTSLGRSPTGVVLDMRGKGSAEVESALTNIYLDRVRIWFVNDLQTKGSFETYFGGATIGKIDRKGWLKVEGHRAKRVRIVNDQLTEVEWQTGIRQRFHYEEVDGVNLITRIERNVADDQEVLCRFKRMGERMVPIRYEFRAIFGKDWGPEIYTLSNLRLTK